MNLVIDNRQNQYQVNEEILHMIERAIKTCLSYEEWDENYEVSLSFVGNEEIQSLNRNYRGKNYVTDVLSFPMVDEEGFHNEEEKLLGDIVICVERTLEQAEEYGHSFERELGFLIVHSMFHLMGYDHDTEENTKIMREKEEAVLKSLGLVRK